jgi:hypothetical protein
MRAHSHSCLIPVPCPLVYSYHLQVNDKGPHTPRATTPPSIRKPRSKRPAGAMMPVAGWESDSCPPVCGLGAGWRRRDGASDSYGSAPQVRVRIACPPLSQRRRGRFGRLAGFSRDMMPGRGDG